MLLNDAIRAAAAFVAGRGVVMADNVAFDPKVFFTVANRGHTVSDLRREEVVFHQSAEADAIYIQKGKIKIVVTSEHGKEAVVGILEPGQFFGEGCLIGQSLRLATAKALTESQVVRISKAEIVRVLHAEPAFAEWFMTHLLTRNRRGRLGGSTVEIQRSGSRGRFCYWRTSARKVPAADYDAHQPGNAGRDPGATRPRGSHFMNKFRSWASSSTTVTCRSTAPC